MVTWVLQKESNFDHCETNAKIIERLKETGHDGVEIFIVPFSHEVHGGDPVITGPVVVYGSSLMDEVSERLSWYPAVWQSDGIDEAAVAAALGELYMNHEMVKCSVHDAAKVAAKKGWEFFFVKPDVAKYFAGQVVDHAKYPFFIESALSYEFIPNEFEVCVSPIKDMGIEWRLVVVEGKVVDYSIYRQYRNFLPERSIYDEVLEVAAKAIELHDPAPIYVIDIGQVDDTLKVIEYNGFNHAGLYECDIPNVVDAINEYVMNNV